MMRLIVTNNLQTVSLTDLLELHPALATVVIACILENSVLICIGFEIGSPAAAAYI